MKTPLSLVGLAPLVGLAAALFAVPAAAAPRAGGYSAPPSSPPASQSSPLLGPVERLPADAYPAPTTRGLYGGSLWMVPDLHGQQWPYYPKTGIGISGYVWFDGSAERLQSGEPLNGSTGFPGQVPATEFLTGARFVLRATPTWSDGKYFVQGQGELVGTKLDTSNGNTILFSADDLWVKTGKWHLFDVQVGRFQAWEVFHLGMGLDLYTVERNGATGPLAPPAIYAVDNLEYRQLTVGQAAVHLYPLDWLRFEIQGQYGSTTNGLNSVGVRPAAIADFGWLKIKAAGELADQRGQQDGAKNENRQQGGGGGFAVVVDPTVEFGLNGAYVQNDARDTAGVIQGAGTNFKYTLGGFANVRIIEDLLLGAGLDYTYTKDQLSDTADQWQGFGALQYLLLKQLFIKGVFAYALADLNATGSSPAFKNEMWSGRLRLEYLF